MEGRFCMTAYTILHETQTILKNILPPDYHHSSTALCVLFLRQYKF
jgi:hypothetical protein